MVFAGKQTDDGLWPGGGWALYRANADGSDPQVVQWTAGREDSALSPDGYRVAYSEPGSGALSVLDLRTGQTQVIYTGTCGCNLLPQWFPDGSRLVFDSDGPWTINADGSGLAPIGLDLPAGVDAPGDWFSVAPDGQRLTFSTYVDSGPHLYNRAVFISNVDGSGVRQITDPWTSYPGDVAFSRDGRRLAYLDSSGGSVRVVGTDGASDQLVASGLPWQDLEWTPDGALLVTHNDGHGGPTIIDRIATSGERLGSMISGFAWVGDPSFPQAVDRDAALAHRFRPILRFDTSESWRPVNVERFFDETFADGQEQTRHQLCPSYATPGAGCAPWRGALSPPSLMLNDEVVAPDAPDSSWPYIDVHGVGDEIDNFKSPRLAQCPHGSLNDCDEGINTAFYYHSSGPYPEADYRFFDYWAFYRYNKFDPGDHEADWENVVVAVPNESDPQDFAWVGMSAHGPVNRYLRSALHCDNDLSDYSCGTETLPSGKDRPVVFVANGSHANYPRRCDADLGGAATCPRIDLGTPVGEKGHDGERPWGANDDPSALEQMPDWARWRGWWGMLGGESHVRSPGLQPYFDRPFAAICTDKWAQDESCPGDGARGSMTDADGAQAAPEGDPCAAWNGPGVAATICDPPKLTAAMASGELGVKPGPVVNATGAIDGRFASSGGVTQIMGSTLDLGDTLTLDASLSADTELLVRFRDHETIRRARFAASDLPDGRRHAPRDASERAIGRTRPTERRGDTPSCSRDVAVSRSSRAAPFHPTAAISAVASDHANQAPLSRQRSFRARQSGVRPDLRASAWRRPARVDLSALAERERAGALPTDRWLPRSPAGTVVRAQ